MNINEAISKLELAGFTVVDEKECSLDNLARLVKENYGVEVKVNNEGIYFDYDEIAVAIDRSNPQEFELTFIDEATNKPIYQDVRNFERSLENIR
jgi:hypothetical protein